MRKIPRAIRAYTLRLYANPGKAEDTRYALWWYRRYTLDYCKRYYEQCSLDWESTEGKGRLPNQAQSRARDIIKAGYAAYAATGNPFSCPQDFPLLCEGIIGKNKGTTFTYWIKTPLGPWLPAQTHKALKNALRRGGQLRKACEVRQGKRGGLVARVFVEFPKQPPIDTTNYLACDVGVNAGVARSDGYVGKSLRPVMNRTREKRAEQQRQGQHKSSARSAVKQTLNREAQRTVMLAKRCGQTLCLEDPKALSNLKPSGAIGGWPRVHFATRVQQIAEIENVAVRFFWPAGTSTTCPRCGLLDKRNRRGVQFCCLHCGYVRHADVLAAENGKRKVAGVSLNVWRYEKAGIKT